MTAVHRAWLYEILLLIKPTASTASHGSPVNLTSFFLTDICTDISFLSFSPIPPKPHQIPTCSQLSLLQFCKCKTPAWAIPAPTTVSMLVADTSPAKSVCHWPDSHHWQNRHLRGKCELWMSTSIRGPPQMFAGQIRPPPSVTGQHNHNNLQLAPFVVHLHVPSPTYYSLALWMENMQL